MKLSPRQRWFVLGGLLTATLAAVLWVNDLEDDESIVMERAVDEGRRTTMARAPASAQPRRIAQRNVGGPERLSRNDALPATPQVRLDKLEARSLGKASKDPFALPRRAVKKAPKPKPKPVVVAKPPPPPPSAPPLPFTYMGKMMAGTEVSVFLTHGKRNLVVHEGDMIDSKYRVDRIEETAMALTYLPLEQQQTLDFGEGR